MNATLEALLRGQSLSEGESRSIAMAIASGQMPEPAVGAVLAALRAKGETAAEVRGFAGAMRSVARRPALPPVPDAVDIVGTGGDSSGSVNLSTGAALLAAACGVPVVKHGNRAVSGRCGSADVLAQLGMPVPLDEHAAADLLASTGFTFLFAPHYHPAMARVAPIRRALGVRTIFNLLGPLTNPAEPPYAVIGASTPAAAALLAEALAEMPVRRAFVVHGCGGWDEPTPVGEFECFDVRPGRVVRGRRDPMEFGVRPCREEDLRGGDAAENAALLRTALCGVAGPVQEALVLGAAMALEVSGRAADPREAASAARAAIADGRAAAVLEGIAAAGRRSAEVAHG